MALEFTTSYVQDALSLFRYYKRLAERAMEQVTDEQLFAVLDSEANSIAIIVKHMAGNMRSRWTGFLTTDGEKPNRDRDSEFIDPAATRSDVLAACRPSIGNWRTTRIMWGRLFCWRSTLRATTGSRSACRVASRPSSTARWLPENRASADSA
jgi:hypothetical protein